MLEGAWIAGAGEPARVFVLDIRGSYREYETIQTKLSETDDPSFAVGGEGFSWRKLVNKM